MGAAPFHVRRELLGFALTVFTIDSMLRGTVAIAVGMAVRMTVGPVAVGPIAVRVTVQLELIVLQHVQLFDLSVVEGFFQSLALGDRIRTEK